MAGGREDRRPGCTIGSADEQRTHDASRKDAVRCGLVLASIRLFGTNGFNVSPAVLAGNVRPFAPTKK